MLGEAADVHLQSEGITEETAEAVDDDDIEWVIVIARPLDHPLELVPVVVHGGGARLDIFGDDRPPLPLAIRGGLKALVRDGKVDLGLPGVRRITPSGKFKNSLILRPATIS